MDKYSADDMARAITKAHGRLSTVASNMHCTLMTVHNYVRKYKCCQEAVYSAREALIDTAEDKLVERVQGGDLKAIKYYLNTQGKDRGYHEGPERNPSRDGQSPPGASFNTINMLNMDNKELMNAIKQFGLPGTNANTGLFIVGSSEERVDRTEPALMVDSSGDADS